MIKMHYSRYYNQMGRARLACDICIFQGMSDFQRWKYIFSCFSLLFLDPPKQLYNKGFLACRTKTQCVPMFPLLLSS